MALALLAGPLLAQSPPVRCPIGGEAIHWVADYCMMTLETDDEIAASECIDKERKAAPRTACAAKLHYKRRMCILSATTNPAQKTVDACLKDPAFMGRTVKSGGVGG